MNMKERIRELGPKAEQANAEFTAQQNAFDEEEKTEAELLGLIWERIKPSFRAIASKIPLVTYDATGKLEPFHSDVEGVDVGQGFFLLEDGRVFYQEQLAGGELSIVRALEAGLNLETALEKIEEVLAKQRNRGRRAIESKARLELLREIIAKLKE